MYLHHLCILCRWNNTVYLVLNIPFKLKSILQAFFFWYKVLKNFNGDWPVYSDNDITYSLVRYLFVLFPNIPCYNYKIKKII